MSHRFFKTVEDFHRRAEPEPNTGCWLWTGTTDGAGYGRVMDKGRGVQAHRFVWALANGPIPKGLCVRHFVCGQPLCVNPGHLRLGTVADNNRDTVRDGRTTRGSRNSTAKLTEEAAAKLLGLLRAGGSVSELARQYGITSSTAWHLRERRTWRHLGAA